MDYMYGSDNHGVDLSGLGAPKKHRSGQRPIRMGQRPPHGGMSPHVMQGLDDYEDNSMSGFLGDLGLTAEQKAAKAEAKARKQADAKAKQQATKVAREQKQADAKAKQQATKVARRQTAEERKAEAKAKAAERKTTQQTKVAERKTKAAEKKAARIAGRNVNVTAKNPADQPKADALAKQIDQKASAMKSQVPQLQAKLKEKQAKRDELKKKLAEKKAAKGKTAGVPKKQPTGLTIKKSVTSPRQKVVLPRRPITKLKGIGFLGMSWLGEGDYETQMGYFGQGADALTNPTGTTVSAAPVMPQGYMNRKNRGRPNVKDQLYELTLYTQQTVGPLADEMARMEEIFNQLVEQMNTVDAEIQDLLNQIASEPIVDDTGTTTIVDDGTGGLIDTGSIDTGGGMEVGYGEIGTGYGGEDTGSGLEVSQAETGSGVSIPVDQGDIYSGEEGVDYSTSPMLPPATIAPQAPQYQDAAASEYQTEDISPVDVSATADMTEEGVGMDYEGEILSPTETMVPPLPRTPVGRKPLVPPTPVRIADQTPMFPPPVVSAEDVTGGAIQEEATGEEAFTEGQDIGVESGSDESEAPVVAPVAMDDRSGGSEFYEE